MGWVAKDKLDKLIIILFNLETLVHANLKIMYVFWEAISKDKYTYSIAVTNCFCCRFKFKKCHVVGF